MRLPTSALRTAVAAGFLFVAASTGRAQVATDSVTRIDLPAGRSYPITTQNNISRISVATPEIADAVVVGERDLVINAKANGETDIIVWITNEPRRHYRIAVHSVADRKSVHLAVRIAEVRKDLSFDLGVNGLYRDGNVRAGTGIFGSDNIFDKVTGDVLVPSPTRFGTILTDFGTKNFLAFLDFESQRGNARLLAERGLSELLEYAEDVQVTTTDGAVVVGVRAGVRAHRAVFAAPGATARRLSFSERRGRAVDPVAAALVALRTLCE